jgi:hypothetical protein
MNSLLHIGNDNVHSKDSAKEAAEAIDTIFSSARTNTMDQPTVVAALESMARVAEIKQITICGSSFYGGAPTPENTLDKDAPSDTPDEETPASDSSTDE